MNCLKSWKCFGERKSSFSKSFLPSFVSFYSLGRVAYLNRVSSASARDLRRGCRSKASTGVSCPSGYRSRSLRSQGQRLFCCLRPSPTGSSPTRRPKPRASARRCSRWSLKNWRKILLTWHDGGTLQVHVFFYFLRVFLLKTKRNLDKAERKSFAQLSFFEAVVEAARPLPFCFSLSFHCSAHPMQDEMHTGSGLCIIFVLLDWNQNVFLLRYHSALQPY